MSYRATFSRSVHFAALRLWEKFLLLYDVAAIYILSKCDNHDRVSKNPRPWRGKEGFLKGTIAVIDPFLCCQCTHSSYDLTGKRCTGFLWFYTLKLSTIVQCDQRHIGSAQYGKTLHGQTCFLSLNIWGSKSLIMVMNWAYSAVVAHFIRLLHLYSSHHNILLSTTFVQKNLKKLAIFLFRRRASCTTADDPEKSISKAQRTLVFCNRSYIRIFHNYTVG